jgi:DinB superfamily
MTTDALREFTTLSLADVAEDLSAMADDARLAFGRLDDRRINWRPSAERWSVAQCLDHVLRTDARMLQAVDAAMQPGGPRSVWQRLPGLPRLFGRMLIRSQSPGSARRYRTSPWAAPAWSAIDGGIVERFAAHRAEAAGRVRALEGRGAETVVMVSPFVPFVAYSVLDGCRLVAAHQRRHYEQARRVTEEPGFPDTP